MLRFLLNLFTRDKKEPTQSWAERVDQWILEDYPQDH